MKKNLKGKKLKKALALSLILACLAFAAGCANPTNDPDSTIGSGDMAGTDWSDRILDKGGANGTDNISIMDDLYDPETTVENDPYPVQDDTLKKDTDNVINDLESAADDVADDITGTTTTDKNAGAATGTGTGTTGTGSSATGTGVGTYR